jgi:hypothetical protein
MMGCVVRMGEGKEDIQNFYVETYWEITRVRRWKDNIKMNFYEKFDHV